MGSKGKHWTLSTETRARMSIYQSNRTLEHQEKLSISARTPKRRAASAARRAKWNRENPMPGRRNGFYGKRHTEETKRLIAEKTANQHAKGVFSRWPNGLELALRRMLNEVGFVFREQVQFERCTVDAWVPGYGLVFEADGTAWHQYNAKQRPGYYQRRDWFLEQQPEIKAVIHLSEEDLAPWM